MDGYPAELNTGGGGVWRRRADLDGDGIAYEYQPGGAIGRASGRLSASIPAALASKAVAWLAERGLHVRTLNADEDVAVSIEADEPLRPLKMFREISSVAGLENVQPEILLPKSKRR